MIRSGKETYERLRYFKPSEFAMPWEMDPQTLYRLDRARDLAGVPFKITSSVRPPKDDTDTSSHLIGRAVDIRAHDSATRFAIVQGAVRAGFRRIGVYDLHVHLDDDPAKPADIMWIGESK